MAAPSPYLLYCTEFDNCKNKTVYRISIYAWWYGTGLGASSRGRPASYWASVNHHPQYSSRASQHCSRTGLFVACTVFFASCAIVVQKVLPKPGGTLEKEASWTKTGSKGVVWCKFVCIVSNKVNELVTLLLLLLKMKNLTAHKLKTARTQWRLK